MPDEIRPEIAFDATILFMMREKDGQQEVLLAKKKRGIGIGLWNGYGGGINEGETPEAAACREFAEETEGATTEECHLENRGTIDFHNMKEDGTTFIVRCYLYVIRDWHGEPKETSEMSAPVWFPIDSLPFDELMPADKFWIPLILAGEKIDAEAHYRNKQKELIGEVIFRPAPLEDTSIGSESLA